jgi:hypothetical protein
MPTGADIVAYARQQLGKPYAWGSEGPNSFDCSGLVKYVYQHVGLSTPRTTSDMMSRKSPLRPIGRADLQPGDLILSHWGSMPPHSHVAIYAGGGQVIEASHKGTPVRVLTYGPDYAAHTDAYRRVPGINGAAGTDPGDILGAVSGVGGVLAGMIPQPGNVTEALTNVGNAAAGIAQSVVGVGELASTVSRALLPSNLLRGVMFLFGVALVFVGILFLAREIKESNA